MINQTPVYQMNFSRLMPNAMYAEQQRLHKALKIIAVLDDYLPSSTASLKLLDIGCSTGIMTNFLAGHFAVTIGVDIDEEAVQFATKRKRASTEKASFLTSDAMDVPFLESSFDVVICAHVYEHVPDARRMISEIHRVLKPGGICFFSAGNRLSLIEPHYRLPLLSVLPKPLAHWYLKSLGRGTHYYEKHLTYWGLRKLVSQFQIIDYTTAIIENPVRFAATDVCAPGSRLQRLAAVLARKTPWLIPTYIFLLRKDAAQR